LAVAPVELKAIVAAIENLKDRRRITVARERERKVVVELQFQKR
jgi:hypothetical protein